MGYADLGCYGQTYIETPHIDRMAAEGIRFTQAYCGSPVSAPSRCCFMTGQHSGHTRIRGNREHWRGAVQYGINNDYAISGQEPYDSAHVIIPEIFKDNGYTTGMFGKWAAGYEGSHYTPDRHGIDEYYGYICQFQAHLYYPNFLNRYSKSLGDTAVVREILTEWIAFRSKCVTRELNYDLEKKKDKLELLEGLMKILVDIDEAIRIIRNTKLEADVVPNLASAFGLTTRQAEYIADIKLRNINREYIINRGKEVEGLCTEIKDIKETLRDELKLKAHIISTLQDVKKKYGKPRRTAIVEKVELAEPKKDIFFENYNCRLLLTHAGYFKKLSQQAIRASDDHKLKDGDYVIYQEDTDNKGEMLFFTNMGQIYRCKVADFEISKPSQMGDFIATKLSMDEGERVVSCKMLYEFDPKHHFVYLFENGKGVRVSLGAYEAKSKRKKITGAYSNVSPLVGAIYEGDKPVNIFIRSTGDRGMLIKSSLIPEKSTRTAAGIPNNA
jgi:DNA gyrase/topoisomerase IV subunit A